jgi:peptide/nickel transport system permease protein
VSGRLAAVARRIALTVPTLAAVVIGGFLLMQLAPGDVVDSIVAEMGSASPGMAAAMRARLGLNDSLPLRLAHFANGLVHGDLGYSPIYKLPVAQLIAERLPASLALAGAAMALALLAGTVLGVVMATTRHRWLARAIDAVLVAVYSVPGFATGLILVVMFSVRLRWLPPSGIARLGETLSPGARAIDLLTHLALPAITLSLFYVATYARLVRSAMIEVLARDFIRTAAAKGASRRAIVWKHALRNALVPLVAVAGNNIAAIVSGAITVEAVFDWPGIGRLALDAVLRRDFAVVTGVLITSALVVVIANAVVDVIQVYIDPRIAR